MPPKRAGGGQAASAEPPSKRLRSEGRGAGPTARAAAASAAAGGKRGEKPEPATAPRTSKAAAGAKKKPKGKQQEAPGRGGGAADAITINRAPVLTLWAAVVAQRQGHSWEAALTFGHLIAGWLAQSKGRRWGARRGREAATALHCLNRTLSARGLKPWPLQPGHLRRAREVGGGAGGAGGAGRQAGRAAHQGALLRCLRIVHLLLRWQQQLAGRHQSASAAALNLHLPFLRMLCLRRCLA